MPDIANELQRLLNDTAETGSANAWSLESVRDWLARLLADYQEEYSDAPDVLRARPMWDLAAMDTDPARDAMFIAAVFFPSNVEFVAGRGRSADVRRFGDSEFPADPANLREALRSRFPLTKVLSLARTEVDAWVGS
jgi:hypothetical protein